jgi:H/ACA ribonucleoprotein complex subunit 4
MDTLPFEKHTQEFLTKREAETSLKYGKKPEERTMQEMLAYGIINIDKPSGPTSHQISAFVKDILHAGKAGHSGTLDPGVTGVLPIGINKATRIMQWLLTAGKEYVALMHLHEEIPPEKIQEAVKKYVGKIKQLPPVKSAVKRQLRERTVYYVEIIEIDGKDVLFRIGCQAGTYIRKWIHDFGIRLNINAHMVELRRTKAGPFNESTLTKLQDLKDAYHYYKEEHDESYLKKILIHPEYAVSHLKKIYVMDTTVDTLCHGAFLKIPGIATIEKGIAKDDIVGVFTLKDELILVGRALMRAEDIMESEKGIAVQTEQVFMDPGVYPKMEK